MKFIKRVLANIHNFIYSAFASCFPPKKMAIKNGETTVMTPLGELSMTRPTQHLKKETITWYGFRHAVSYWLYDNGVVGSHATWNVV